MTDELRNPNLDPNRGDDRNTNRAEETSTDVEAGETMEGAFDDESANQVTTDPTTGGSDSGSNDGGGGGNDGGGGGGSSNDGGGGGGGSSMPDGWTITREEYNRARNRAIRNYGDSGSDDASDGSSDGGNDDESSSTTDKSSNTSSSDGSDQTEDEPPKTNNTDAEKTMSTVSGEGDGKTKIMDPADAESITDEDDSSKELGQRMYRSQYGADDLEIDPVGQTPAERRESFVGQVSAATGLSDREVLSSDGELTSEAKSALRSEQAARQVTQETGLGTVASDVSVDDEGNIEIVDPDQQNAQLRQEVNTVERELEQNLRDDETTVLDGRDEPVGDNVEFGDDAVDVEVAGGEFEVSLTEAARSQIRESQLDDARSEFLSQANQQLRNQGIDETLGEDDIRQAGNQFTVTPSAEDEIESSLIADEREDFVSQVNERLLQEEGIADGIAADDVEFEDGEFSITDSAKSDIEDEMAFRQAAGTMGGVSDEQQEQLDMLNALATFQDVQQGRLQEARRERFGATTDVMRGRLREAAQLQLLDEVDEQTERDVGFEDVTFEETEDGLSIQLRDDTFQRESETGGTQGLTLGNLGTGIQRVGDLSVAAAEAFQERIGDPTAEVVADIADIPRAAGSDVLRSEPVSSILGNVEQGDTDETIEAIGDVFRGEEGQQSERSIIEVGTERFTEGAVSDAGSMLISAPETGISLAELGAGSAQFTAEQVREEGPVEGAVESGQAAGNFAVGRLSTAYEQAASNPVQTAGVLAGTAGIMGGASRLAGGGANLATRAAIQPGEELIGFAGNRALGSISPGAARTLFPDNEPLLMSEESAIRTAQAAASRTRRGVERLQQSVEGEFELSPSPRQSELISRFRPEGTTFETETTGTDPVRTLDVTAEGTPDVEGVERPAPARSATESGQVRERGAFFGRPGEADTESGDPPLREEIRDEGGLGFFLGRGDVEFDEPRARFDAVEELVPSGERGQASLAGPLLRTETETETEPEQPDYQDFSQLEEARQSELRQRNELQSDINRGETEMEQRRREEAEQPFTEVESETEVGEAESPAFRVQPFADEDETQGQATELLEEAEQSDLLGNRPQLDGRVGVQPRTAAFEQEMQQEVTLLGLDQELDTELGQDLGTELEQELDQELDTELEQETLLEQEFETETEAEQETLLEQEFETETESEFETEAETELETEFEMESESEFELETEGDEQDQPTLFELGTVAEVDDELFSSGLLSGEDILSSSDGDEFF